MKHKKMPSDVGDKSSVNKNEKSAEEEAEGSDTDEEVEVQEPSSWGNKEPSFWVAKVTLLNLPSE